MRFRDFQLTLHGHVTIHRQEPRRGGATRRQIHYLQIQWRQQDGAMSRPWERSGPKRALLPAFWCHQNAYEGDINNRRTTKKMTPKHRVRIALLTVAVFLMAANVSAATITFSTTTPAPIGGFSTGFGADGSTGMVLNSTIGAAGTITFAPRGASTVDAPTGIDFGTFTVACQSCSTAAIGGGAFFPAFTFDLVVSETSPSVAAGRFVGTAAAGTVYSDQNPITINWAPLQLGPGTSYALSGDFGTVFFNTTVFTQLVALNSGAVPGQTTVQGTVSDSAIPEPATLGLLGGGLLALGLLRRKKLSRP